MKRLDIVRETSKKFEKHLKDCRICPRRCGVDRTCGTTGYCRAGLKPVIYSHLVHHGEEPPISGHKGSGTIFFSRCNMKCVYCQNYYFSQLDKGEEVGIPRLGNMMLELEVLGCHNINLVSPTHYLPQILQALEIAIGKGLSIPIVYNTSGYDLAETIRELRGIIDIYMPDMRYSDSSMAELYSDAPDYAERNREAVSEMQSQVGDLVVDKDGIARRGLLIRLLALPGGISGTVKTLKFIREHISKNAYLSIMSQYYPTFKAYDYSVLSRGVSAEEYNNVVDEARILGLNNGWIQDSPEPFDRKFFGTNIRPRKKAKEDGKENK